MRHTCLMLAALLALGPSLAPARTWTSRSGSTIEAELTGRDGAFVTLQGADGRRFKIQVTKLSAADQAYLDAPAPADPAPTPDVPAPAPVFASVVFRPPPPLTTDQIPGVELLAAAGAIGLQFGPGPDDVLYLIVDTASLTELPRELYLYSPGLPDYQTPVTIAGKRGKYNDQRVVRFSKIPIGASFSALQASYELELVCGIERPDITAVLIDVRLAEAGEVSRFSLGGYLNEAMLHGPGQIPVLPILARPEIRAAVNTRPQLPTVTPRVTMGPFTVRPSSRKIALTVTETSGKTAERLTVEVTEEDLLAYQHGEMRVALEKVDPATAYTLRAAADLGGILGAVSTTNSFTTRDEEH